MKLSPEEYKVYNLILTKTGRGLTNSKMVVLNAFKDAEDMKQRFEVLYAQFNAGNDSKDMINELLSIVNAFEKNGTIDKETAREFVELFTDE